MYTVMITVIKKGSTAETVKKKLNKHQEKQSRKDLSKYCGVIKLKEDPVVVQKKIRDEWE